MFTWGLRKVISWNTNGLRATIKQGNFEPLFKKYDPDIVCFQETKSEREQIPEKFRDYKNYQSFFSHSKTRKGYSGVAIYTREKPISVSEGIGIKELDQEGRILVAKFKTFTLITGYYPNGGQGPHRLLEIGWGRRRIAIFYWIISGILGFASLFLVGSEKLIAFVTISTVLLVFIIFINRIKGPGLSK
jgi:hypothetical protein